MARSIFNFRKISYVKEILATAGLLFNMFSWYYLCRLVVARLGQNHENSSLFTIVYLISTVVSAITGATFFKEKRQLHLLRVWIIFGVIASLLLTIITPASLSYLGVSVIIALLGISLGVALPFCLDLIRLVAIENRGKVGGVILLAVFSSLFILYEIVSSLDFMLIGFILAIWRGWSLPLLFIISEKLSYENNVKEFQKFASILTNRVFLLYLTAWFMFAFIDNFQGVVIWDLARDFSLFIRLIEPLVAGFSAVIIGIITDRNGRKPVLICSFIFLGIADAVLGLFPHQWASWLFYSITNGMAIGSAFVLFTVVIWGEISTKTSAKLYAIGEIPFFIADALSIPLTPFLSRIPYSSSFSLASFFLFVAVIPLVFAPETLPEKVLKEKELRGYIERAKRIREKFTKR